MRTLLLLLAIGLALPVEVFAQDVLQPGALLSRARAVLLVEEEHGSTIVAKAPALELPVASLTKLMTALVFLEGKPSWNRDITITAADIVGPGKKVLEVGDRIGLKNLFSLMLVHSDNTAAMALARSRELALNEFVAAMNGKARVMGLAHSRFVEPTGLDAGNQSTASDLVRLASVAFETKEVASSLALPSLQFSIVRTRGKAPKTVSKRVVTTNALLGRKVGAMQIQLGKTGTTDEAGYSYIVRAGTLSKRPTHFLGVILATANQRDRFDVALDVLRFGASQFSPSAPPAPSPGIEVHTALAR